MSSLSHSTSINTNIPIQDKSLPIKDIKDFPSKQAEKLQQHLKFLDNQGKLKEEFLKRYSSNLGKPNSLANYILSDFENRKHLFIEYTGIETFNDKHTISTINIKLNEITIGSNSKLLWKCSTCGNEWVSQLNMRTSKHSGCPACSKNPNKLIKGKNDLETFCKEQSEFKYLLEEFIGEDTSGNKILPSEISRSSCKEVKWKCRYCNYEWIASVNNRTNIKTGCPACSGKICIPGKNDLETYCTKQHPELGYILEEFTGIDKDKNHIKPTELARASAREVYWKCRTCHKLWLASPHTRTGTIQRGCPHCAEYLFTSFPEQYIYHCLKQLFPNTKSRVKDKINNYEYDIVVPELNLCIEYSGYTWHKDKLERDQDKANHCKEAGIQFIQIYAHNGEITDNYDLDIDKKYTKEKIIYKVDNNKSQHILQLQHIVNFILKEYYPNHSIKGIKSINFQLAEQEANKVMNKA